MNAQEQEHMWSTRYRSAGEDYVFGTTPNRLPRRTGGVAAAGPARSVADGEGATRVWAGRAGARGDRH